MNNQTQFSKTGDHVETPYNSSLFCLKGFGDHGSSDLATYLDESQPAILFDGNLESISMDQESLIFSSSFLNISSSETHHQTCLLESLPPSSDQDEFKLSAFTFDQLESGLPQSMVNEGQSNESCSYIDNTPTLSPVSELITAMSPDIKADKFLPISPPQSLLSSPNPHLSSDNNFFSTSSSTFQENNVGNSSPFLFSPAPSPLFESSEANSCKASFGNIYKPVPCNDAFSNQSCQLIPVNPQFLEPDQSSQSPSQLFSLEIIATHSSEAGVDNHSDQHIASNKVSLNQTSPSFFQTNLIPVCPNPRSSPLQARTGKRGRKKKVLTPAEQKAQETRRKEINAEAAKRSRKKKKKEKEKIVEEIRMWDEKFDRQWYLDIERQNNILDQDLIREIMDS